MFRRIVAIDNGNKEIREERAKALFSLHPHQISTLLEMAWEFCVKFNPNNTDSNTPKPIRTTPLHALPSQLLTLFGAFEEDSNSPNSANFNFYNSNKFKLGNDTSAGEVPNLLGMTSWDHLIYAYLIENTRIYDVFRKVLFEYLHGEKISVPLFEAHRWLRNTEELFFSNPAPFRIYNISSQIRPDFNAYRRNIYYRMFGMDLNHGDYNNQPVKFHKPDLFNKEFVKTLEEFLREVWVGIVNVSNTSGLRPTDNVGIANLAMKLHDMLQNRRRLGNLTREEFFFVSMMSWFHLTVEFDSPIIQSLRAEGTREQERLFRVAELVGFPAHAKSYNFFQLADPLSRILTQIETGIYNYSSAVPALYQPETPIVNDMRNIILHWSIATGRDLKVRRGKDVAQSIISATTNGVNV